MEEIASRALLRRELDVAVHAQQRLDGAPFIHGAIALGHLLERQGEVEDRSFVEAVKELAVRTLAG